MSGGRRVAAARRAWLAFVAWVGTTEPATSLALFRIAIALSLLLELASIAHGSFGPLFLGPEAGGIYPPAEAHWLLELVGTSGGAVRALFGSSALSAAALLLGVGSRPAALVAMATFSALCALRPDAGGSHDRLFTIALWLLALSGSGATLSASCRLRTGRWWSLDPVPAWPRYLLALQIVLVYTSTGVVKLGASWWPAGSYLAVYHAILQPAWARFDPAWVAHVVPLTQVATAVTWWWEFTWWVVPMWLVARRRGSRWARFDLRAAYVALGIVVHTTLWVLMDLGPFSPLTMSFYLCLFHPDELWRRRPG